MVDGETVPYVAGWGEDGALEAVSEYAKAIDELARRIENVLTADTTSRAAGGCLSTSPEVRARIGWADTLAFGGSGRALGADRDDRVSSQASVGDAESRRPLIARRSALAARDCRTQCLSWWARVAGRATPSGAPAVACGVVLG
jgi:hypothetical protein